MKPLAVQRMVLAWILGPLGLVAGCYLLATLLSLLAGPNPSSWAFGLGLFFINASFFGTFVAAHVLVLFGLIGVVKLSRSDLQRKPFTLFVCFAGLAIGAVVLSKLYLGIF